MYTYWMLVNSWKECVPTFPNFYISSFEAFHLTKFVGKTIHRMNESENTTDMCFPSVSYSYLFYLNNTFLPLPHVSLLNTWDQLDLSSLCFPCFANNRFALVPHHTFKQAEPVCTKTNSLPMTWRCTHPISVCKWRQNAINLCFFFPLPGCFHIWQITPDFPCPSVLSASPPFLLSLVYKFRQSMPLLTAMRLFYDKELNCSISKAGLATF